MRCGFFMIIRLFILKLTDTAMKVRFIRKHIDMRHYSVPAASVSVDEEPKKAVKETVAAAKNNTPKEDKAMDIDEIEKLASELTPEQTTKKIKKDKGLIERTESSKIMITEDNKQLLKD